MYKGLGGAVVGSRSLMAGALAVAWDHCVALLLLLATRAGSAATPQAWSLYFLSCSVTEREVK